MPNAFFSVHKSCRGVAFATFARGLQEMAWNFFGTKGSSEFLNSQSIRTTDIATLTGREPILEHRVASLSQEIPAGLLAKIGRDEPEMAELKLPIFDLAFIIFYPLALEIRKPGATLESVIEETDIGGPTMLRAGAKGNRIVIGDLADLDRVLDWIKAGQPNRDEFINDLAAKAELLVTEYSGQSMAYRSNGRYSLHLSERVRNCCYGENAHQAPAALYREWRNNNPLGLYQFELVEGSEPSYNNWADIDRLLHTVNHIAAVFDKNRGQVPHIAVLCKHGNACGASIGSTPETASHRMAIGDPLASFGGTVMTNFPITKSVAEIFLQEEGQLLDGVAAPSFDSDAIPVLRRSKTQKCRMYANPALARLSQNSLNHELIRKTVHGGSLTQPNYTYVLDLNDPALEKPQLLSLIQEENLMLAWGIGSTSNTNTVCVVKDKTLLGNAVAQQDRVGACFVAIYRAQRSKHELSEAVAYSDSFFPQTDGPSLLADAGIRTILSSSGSQNDSKVRALCVKRGVNLCLIPDKIGRGFFGH